MAGLAIFGYIFRCHRYYPPQNRRFSVGPFQRHQFSGDSRRHRARRFERPRRAFGFDNELHGAVARARDAHIKTLVLPPEKMAREIWDHRVADALYEEGVEAIALAGYLRYVTPVLLEAFPGRILNIHPSLLPSFGGQGMFGPRVHRAVLEHGCKISGCTVHLVDERYDTGPILAQAAVAVEDDDTPDSLSLRVQKEEHRLYPQCIEAILQHKIRIEGRRTRKI